MGVIDDNQAAMKIVQEYRRNAFKCQQLAEDNHRDRVSRHTWTSMAVRWTRLADDRLATFDLPPIVATVRPVLL
jgi:hypothetical protein